jgi:rhodanese-related sulfurtransferase
MKRLSLWLVLVLGLTLTLGLFGCGDDDGGTKPGVSEFDKLTTLGDTYFSSYTTPSGLPVNTVASSVYANLIDGNAANDPYILDWRSDAHFALGHIQGAVNVSLANFASVVSGIPAGKTVVNVCYTGQSASYATALMNMLGHDAQNLKFGMCGWTSDTSVNLDKWETSLSNDYAAWLTQTPFTTTATMTNPVLNTGKSDPEEILLARATAAGWKTMSIASLYGDLNAGKAGDYFIINYFNSAEYDAGHIPGAVRFQPNQDLKANAKLLNIPTDKKVVVYCFTGQTSAQVVAYLNALGYDAYSLLYGVNAICHDNSTICTTKYHAADTDYPVVTGS